MKKKIFLTLKTSFIKRKGIILVDIPKKRVKKQVSVSANFLPMTVVRKQIIANIEIGETGETNKNGENNKKGKNENKGENLGTNLT